MPAPLRPRPFLTLLATSLVGLTSCEPPVVNESQLTQPADRPSFEPEGKPGMPVPPQDWAAWAQWVDRQHPVGDEAGHGPDVGSDEWAGALDRQLGISSGGEGPDLKSPEWRAAVEQKLASGSS